MTSVERFVEQAVLFEHWLSHGQDRGGMAARNALVRLATLYRAALDLPRECSDEAAGEPEATPVDHDGWQRAYDAAGRIPLDYYAEVFNPTAIDDREPVMGSLADDLADIYRDVVSGLRTYESGRQSSAVWQWTFAFHTHWGAHAVGAMRALHWWLAGNAPERLSEMSDGPVDSEGPG
jgi:hypothetical protein